MRHLVEKADLERLMRLAVKTPRQKRDVYEDHALRTVAKKLDNGNPSKPWTRRVLE